VHIILPTINIFVCDSRFHRRACHGGGGRARIDLLEAKCWKQKPYTCGRDKKLLGVRNVLVHEYSGIMDGIALESMKELLPSFEGFVEVVERWLEKR